MTARRGSFRFRVSRLARTSLLRSKTLPKWRRRLALLARVASRLIVAAAALVVAGAVGAQTWRVAAEDYRLHKQIDAVERRNEALAAHSTKLAREIELLHDPDYLVPLIHEQLGLVRPHEVFIEIQPTPAPAGN